MDNFKLPDTIQEQSRDDNFGLDSGLKKIGEATAIFKKVASKKLNKGEYVNCLEQIGSTLDKIGLMLTDAIQAKNNTNMKIQQDIIEEYDRALDATTADKELNSFIIDNGIVGLRNNIIAMYKQVSDIIETELMDEDKTVYRQRLQDIQVRTKELQQLHIETNELIENNKNMLEEQREQERLEQERQTQIDQEVNETEDKINSIRILIDSIDTSIVSYEQSINDIENIEDTISKIYKDLKFIESKEKFSQTIMEFNKQIRKLREQIEYNKSAVENKRKEIELEKEQSIINMRNNISLLESSIEDISNQSQLRDLRKQINSVYEQYKKENTDTEFNKELDELKDNLLNKLIEKEKDIDNIAERQLEVLSKQVEDLLIEIDNAISIEEIESNMYDMQSSILTDSLNSIVENMNTIKSVEIQRIRKEIASIEHRVQVRIRDIKISNEIK